MVFDVVFFFAALRCSTILVKMRVVFVTREDLLVHVDEARTGSPDSEGKKL